MKRLGEIIIVKEMVGLGSLFGVTPICDRPYDAEPKPVERFFVMFGKETAGNDGAE